MYLLLLFSFFFARSLQNLACKGGFQEYPLLQSNSTAEYSSVRSSSPCWFRQDGINMFYIRKDAFSTTTVADLYKQPQAYTLCQIISLTPGSFYKVSYTMLLRRKFTYGEIALTINGVSMGKISTSNSNTRTIFNQTIVANHTSNEFCFTPFSTMNPNQAEDAPELDNFQVTIVDVFQNSTTQQIVLGQTVPVTPNIIPTSNTTNTSSQTADAFQLTTNQQQYFEFFHKILLQAAKRINEGHIFSSLYFCSYLFIDLLSLWNLSLIYSFLPIPAMPPFMRTAFDQISANLFKNHVVTPKISQILGWRKNYFQFQSGKITEHIPAKKNNHVWFGSMQISSNFLFSNSQKLLLLSLLVIKTSLLMAISQIPNKITKIFSLKGKTVIVVLMEIISFSPTFIISSGSSINEAWSLNRIDRLNTGAQICFFFILIAAMCLMLTEYPSPKKQKKHSIDTLLIRKQYNFLQNCLYLTVSLCIVLNSVLLFLTLNSLLIVFKFLFFMKNMSCFPSRRDRIFKICINTFWLLHTLLYILFAAYSLVAKGRQFTQIEKRTLKIAGMIVLGLLIFQGTVQLIKMAINFIIFMWRLASRVSKPCFKKLASTYKKKMRDNKIVPEGSDRPEFNEKQSLPAVTRMMTNFKNADHHHINSDAKNTSQPLTLTAANHKTSCNPSRFLAQHQGKTILCKAQNILGGKVKSERNETLIKNRLKVSNTASIPPAQQ